MQEYKNLVKNILENGKIKKDRTGTGTISIFGTQSRYDLTKGFPLVTIKKTWWHGILHELLWFIKGDVNIQYLVKNKVGIWNEWPFRKYSKSNSYCGETQKEFIQKIIKNDEFAKKWGYLGPVYGQQWRNFEGIDQLKNVIEQIKSDPFSRRLIVSAWNPIRIEEMLLPPCHSFFQFYVNDGCLSLQLYQRSADVFLGVPFNIASYSLLLILIAHITKLKPKDFIHTIGDAHVYSNHISQSLAMIERSEKKLPNVLISDRLKNIDDIRVEDFNLVGYDSHPFLKGKVAI